MTPGQPGRFEADAAKFVADGTALAACQCAVPRLAPISAEMILNYIGEKVLGLPRSY